MIDYRLLTFMDLHETMNYTKTAQNLHITQPAVTQHIQYLERKYHVQLFHYEKKHLECTKEGEYLYQHALSLVSGADKLLQELRYVGDERETIHMGATMAVSENLVPQFLSALYQRNPKLDLHLTLADTEVLLKAVREGNVDFAWVEGIFDKSEFRTHLLKKEEMILVLAKDHPLVQRKIVRLEDLLKEHLFLREEHGKNGDVLTQKLAQHNLTPHNFADCTSINQIAMIKKLVANGLGITFLHESAVQEELVNHTLVTRKVKGFKLMREFNMIAQKHSIYQRQYDAYFKFFKQL